MKHTEVREGYWFAVPLDGGGFSLGLVARASKDGKALFGYFFGPRMRDMPSLQKVSDLSPDKSLLMTKFGSYSLYHGEWPVLGMQRPWNRSDWPMPFFSRVDERGKAVRVEYSEEDPSTCVREVPCSVEEAGEYLKDRMLGSHLVVRGLSRLLPE